MCRSMVDIHSAAAEIRRGKKEDRRKETTGQKYNGLPYYIGRAIIITNRKSYNMSFRLVPKSVTLNDLERRNGVILRYFSEFG